jgi:hypothetical protein
MSSMLMPTTRSSDPPVGTAEASALLVSCWGPPDPDLLHLMGGNEGRVGQASIWQ